MLKLFGENFTLGQASPGSPSMPSCPQSLCQQVLSSEGTGPNHKPYLTPLCMWLHFGTTIYWKALSVCVYLLLCWLISTAHAILTSSLTLWSRFWSRSTYISPDWALACQLLLNSHPCGSACSFLSLHGLCCCVAHPSLHVWDNNFLPSPQLLLNLAEPHGRKGFAHKRFSNSY